MAEIKNIVYKYVLDNEIIYIGKSDVGIKRIKQHGHIGDNIDSSAWPDINRAAIYYSEMADSRMADIYESELIRRYKPRLNKAKMNEWAGLPLPDPSWNLFREQASDEDADDREVLLKKLEKTQVELEKVISREQKCKDRLKTVEEQLFKLAEKKKADPYETYLACQTEKNKKMKETLRVALARALSLHDKMLTYASSMENMVRNFQESFLTASGSSKSFDEILKEYKATHCAIAYISIAKNVDGSVNCVKLLYTDAYGDLNYKYMQGTVEYHGSLMRVDDKTVPDYPFHRSWKYRGSSDFYPVPDDGIKKIGSAEDAADAWWDMYQLDQWSKEIGLWTWG